MPNPTHWSIRQAILDHLLATGELAGYFSPSGFNGDVSGLLTAGNKLRESYGKVAMLITSLAYDGAVEQQLEDDARAGVVGDDDGSGRIRTWVDERPHGVGGDGKP